MLSKETLATMRDLDLTKKFVDDPEWETKRALDLLDEVEELRKEVEWLRRLDLTCCSCGKALASLDDLKAHIVVCPEHPIAQYVAAEREACLALTREVMPRDGYAAAGQIANAIRRRGNIDD